MLDEEVCRESDLVVGRLPPRRSGSDPCMLVADCYSSLFLKSEQLAIVALWLVAECEIVPTLGTL